jgi:CrcB protein
MNPYLIVFLGSGLGGALRQGTNVLTARLFGLGFPYGTLTVNIAGAFLMGLMIEWFALKADPGQSWRLFLTTGILGGFTTFSTFSLDAANLIQKGAALTAAIYLGATLVAGLGGLFLAMMLVRSLV